MTTIPANSEEMWIKVLQGDEVIPFEFLATKLLVARLRMNYKIDASTEKVGKYIEELRAFFETGKNISIAVRDLETIKQKY